jgi:hypothetical protein
MLAYVSIVLGGTTWLVSALAFIKARWLFAWISVAAGLAMLVVGAKVQIVAFQADAIRAHPANAQVSGPLSERVASVSRNAQVAGMRVLVVLQGDDSLNVMSVTREVLDYDKLREILCFLPLTVSDAQRKSEAALLEEYGWPLPARGEVVLIALGGGKKVIAVNRISADDVDAAVAISADFLQQHMPPRQDALKLLSEAKQNAQNSGRRVWIVDSGPRCGPCFRLGRWMSDHHATLKKDYVIVKVMGGIDENAAEVIDKLPRKEHGIPWHAITEADGTVLATSEGEMGNIGMPSSVEGIRHFRKMLESTSRRLSANEIGELIESLWPDR